MNLIEYADGQYINMELVKFIEVAEVEFDEYRVEVRLSTDLHSYYLGQPYKTFKEAHKFLKSLIKRIK